MAISLDQAREVWNRPEGQGREDSIYAWGGDAERTDQLAYNLFRQTMGREPNQDEYNRILPYFHGQGAQGRWTGQAYLNQLRQNELNDPTNQNSQYNPNNPQNTLGQYTGQVENLFQELLNRGANQSELDHFRQLLATGQADAFTLGNFIKQLPEYRQREDTQFRGDLAKELEGYDTSAFNRQKENIISDYARRGVNIGTSPALDYALTDLMGKISENRQKFLTGLSAEQYGGRTAAARGDYENYLNNIIENQNYGKRRQDTLGDVITNRMYEGQDYNRQMQDYLDQMNNERRSGNVLRTGDWINLGLFGGNTAARLWQARQTGRGGYWD